ncbi:hypothetical protein [uncultured Cohaesibacter sp.]|uniref:hypothetical protein n=1 Tax=uncultured Cohaesibacter sp. TaxID=1002546 RepID=UPI002AA8CE35|nr:hypothetical protein [uncultured Cohaesibacter sp.]
MASKTVEVKLSVGAIMNLQGPLRRGVKEAGKFQQDMQRHFEKLEKIKGVTALIDNFEKLNKKRQDFSKLIDKQHTLNGAVADEAKEMNNYGVAIGEVSGAKERLKGELQDTASTLDKEGGAWKRS